MLFPFMEIRIKTFIFTFNLIKSFYKVVALFHFWFVFLNALKMTGNG